MIGREDAALEELREQADHLRIKLSLAEDDPQAAGPTNLLTDRLATIEAEISSRVKALGHSR